MEQQQQKNVGMGRNSSQLSISSAKALKEQNMKCAITRLLLGNNQDELLEWTKLACLCLIEEGIYMPDMTASVTDNDAIRTGFMIEIMMTEGNPRNMPNIDIHRKGFIIICLWLSNVFVSKFCPPVDANASARFLVDPVYFEKVFRTKGSWFFVLFAKYVQNCSSMHWFLAQFTSNWLRCDPYANMDIYNTTDPSMKSLEHLLLEGENIDTNSNALLTAIYNCRKHYTNALPYSDMDTDNEQLAITQGKNKTNKKTKLN